MSTLPHAAVCGDDALSSSSHCFGPSASVAPQLAAPSHGTLRERPTTVEERNVAPGSSCAAALRLLRRAGARVVAVAALLVEGDAWRTKLEPDDDLVHYLAKIPIFKRDGPNDDWRPAWSS